MTEPTTEAGRRLLDPGINSYDRAAIERQARADLAARIEERLDAYASDTKAMEPNEWITLAAVLAIVREEAAE